MVASISGSHLQFTWQFSLAETDSHFGGVLGNLCLLSLKHDASEVPPRQTLNANCQTNAVETTAMRPEWGPTVCRRINQRATRDGHLVNSEINKSTTQHGFIKTKISLRTNLCVCAESKRAIPTSIVRRN